MLWILWNTFWMEGISIALILCLIGSFSKKILCFLGIGEKNDIVIKGIVTDRITSLPIVLAFKKGFFQSSGLEVDLRTGVDYKSALTLLEAGRVDFAELPTILYLYDAFQKKSRIKRIYKGIYLAHSPLNFFSKNFFKPHEFSFNKIYEIPVPSQLSPERFFVDRFLERFFPDKQPKIRYVEVPYYLYEKYLRNKNSIGFAGDPFFCPFLNKFYSYDEETDKHCSEFKKGYIPTTMLVFSGQFIRKFAEKADTIIAKTVESIQLLENLDQSDLDHMIHETGILSFFPYFRLGELKQLLLQNALKKEKLFHWKGDSRPLADLIRDHYFHGIKRVIREDEVLEVMNFSPIWEAMESGDVKVSSLRQFHEPGAEVQYAPPSKFDTTRAVIRHLIVDAISNSLDILEGNIHSRLDVDDSMRVENRLRVHINNMLDYFQSELFKLNERIIELENINSILEIKLDRNSVNLQYSEERYRYLFEFSREALLIVDTDSREIIESNLQFRLMSGYSRTELSRIKVDDLIVSEKMEKEFFLGKNKSDAMLNIPDGEIILKDGNRLGVDISINSMLVSPKKRYQIIIRDNRERVESEKAKHEFISNISHELRSPMTNIRGYFELLTEDPMIRTKPETAESLDIIQKNIKRLSFLIENLLKIEKDIKNEEAEEGFEVFDPAVVAEDVIHMNSHLYSEKQLTVHSHLQKGCRIRGIRFEFSQIVSNLFINAIKYTPSGEIHISIQPKDNKILLVVRDTGMGIPEKYLGSIFKRFYRVPSPENKKIGGTGLGLSITHALVEKMGGEIYLETKEGKGTTFTVEVKRVS